MIDPLFSCCPECGANVHLVAHARDCSRRRPVAEPSCTYGPADAARDGFCPYCEAARPWHLDGPTDRNPDGSIGLLKLCTRCGRHWSEVYRLERVELLRPEQKEAP